MAKHWKAELTFLPWYGFDACVKHLGMHLMPLPLGLPGVLPQSTYTSCIHNEIAGLSNRHLVETNPAEPGVWRRARELFVRKYRLNGVRVSPMSEEELIQSRPGRTKRKFQNAFNDLRIVPLNYKDTKIRSFVKVEKADYTKLPAKQPRMIQYRAPRFTACLAKYLAPIEHYFVHECYRQPLAKGKNQRGRAKQLLRTVRRFPGGVIVCIDQTNFDSHIVQDAIRETHHVYKMMLGLPRGKANIELDKLLKAQLASKGKSRHGVKYHIKGTRISGDIDTGLGNSVVNLMLLCGVMADIPRHEWDCVVDGDDCYIVISANYADAGIRALDPANFLKYGMESRTEVITREIHEVEFCQSKLVYLDDGPRMIRKPTRVLARSGFCLQNYGGSGYRKWMYSVGECELACNAGVPVLQEYSAALLRCSKVKSGLKNPEVVAAMRGAVHKAVELPISDAARDSFAKTFGISVSLQLHLESLYRSLQVSDLLEMAVVGKQLPFDILSRCLDHVERLSAAI